MTEFDYDLFVIGGGSGGVRASRIAAELGVRVGLAEERYLGGTCVNVGCVPKKLFSYAAHYAQDFEDAKGYGWEFAPPPRFNWKTLHTNKNYEIARLNDIYLSMLQQAGVQVFQKRATLVDKNTIAIDNRTYTAKEILIATGGWPFVPDFPGKEHSISSNEIFSLDDLPSSILIVGGGYISVEFAGIFTGLGVKTTLISRNERLLRGFDSELTASFTVELEKTVTLRLRTQVARIQKKNATELSIHFDDGSAMTAEAVMFATGRKANSRNMGLEKVGVALADNGAIIVDNDFTTSIPNIHAVGDVINRIALTPVALAEGQILAQRLFGSGKKKMNYENIPTAVFCHPNLACVGLDEESAHERYANIAVYRSRFTPLRHTLSGNTEKYFLKLLVDTTTDKIVGAHMLGSDAGEIIQGLAIAITAGATKADFDATLGIHPTVAEEFVTMRTPS
ncbi:MAG: glutathione-disulfide reductase [Gammaproteobacteria bacterium]|nr:glutathione-disulfide reductase [Gammaproteobacteria bacterium]MDP2141165.1 glutathione-disulfide reductase [Gammaproteobacteria bacterium]MDP2349161.1 glutathione-disulfide reductase [Gammaproteobacteria bacterium]